MSVWFKKNMEFHFSWRYLCLLLGKRTHLFLSLNLISSILAEGPENIQPGVVIRLKMKNKNEFLTFPPWCLPQSSVHKPARGNGRQLLILFFLVSQCGTAAEPERSDRKGHGFCGEHRVFPVLLLTALMAGAFPLPALSPPKMGFLWWRPGAALLRRIVMSSPLMFSCSRSPQLCHFYFPPPPVFTWRRCFLRASFELPSVPRCWIYVYSLFMLFVSIVHVLMTEPVQLIRLLISTVLSHE